MRIPTKTIILCYNTLPRHLNKHALRRKQQTRTPSRDARGWLMHRLQPHLGTMANPPAPASPRPVSPLALSLRFIPHTLGTDAQDASLEPPGQAQPHAPSARRAGDITPLIRRWLTKPELPVEQLYPMLNPLLTEVPYCSWGRAYKGAEGQGTGNAKSVIYGDSMFWNGQHPQQQART